MHLSISLMGLLKGSGLFDLNSSNKHIGSWFKRSDVAEIFSVPDANLNGINFEIKNGTEVINEKDLIQVFKSDNIPGFTRVYNKEKKPRVIDSLDEYVLMAIIKKEFPSIEIQHQHELIIRKSNGHRWNKNVDFLLKKGNHEIFVEFDGIHHFIPTRTARSFQTDAFYLKNKIENEYGIEVVNWPFWIQRCARNVEVLFDAEKEGFAALWSADKSVMFSKFEIDNPADTIKKMTSRFNALDSDGIGYMYGPNSKGRNQPAHPYVDKILQGKYSKELLLPKDYTDQKFWLPRVLW